MMEHYSELQSLLLRWFRHHGTRSIPQILIACRNLNESFSTNLKYPLYSFFLPLLRKGYLEYLGQERYQPAPPVVILNKKDHISTALNLTHSQISHVERFCEIDGPDSFGVIRFKSYRRDLKRMCDELKIDFTDNHIYHPLRQFPAFKDIILCFKRLSGFQCNRYYNVFKHRWEDAGEKGSIGIHKLKNEARQYYFRMDQNGWLKVPSFKENPDSWYVCESFQAILVKKHPCIFYNKAERILNVEKISIPIIIDRILRIPSVHLKNSKDNRYQNISFAAFKQLNRIFSNGIEEI